jgi:hypothetical protein
MTSQVLDTHLRDLEQKEFQAKEMPLAIRRFKEGLGLSSAISAMQSAVAKVLIRYWEEEPLASRPIRVQRLCELLEARLQGTKPSNVNPRNVYEAGGAIPRGHTGKLYVSDSRISIRIPPKVAFATARVSIAHELAHALIHKREHSLDQATMRLPSSPEEEALAEYGARLMLMPSQTFPRLADIARSRNAAEHAIVQSSAARVTIHSAVARLGDPDVADEGIRGAILWRISPQVSSKAAIHARLTPFWHLCPRAFVPIGKCKAKGKSVVANASENEAMIADSAIEDVQIGTFVGRFQVDVLAWGSINDATRLALSVFRSPF